MLAYRPRAIQGRQWGEAGTYLGGDTLGLLKRKLAAVSNHLAKLALAAPAAEGAVVRHHEAARAPTLSDLALGCIQLLGCTPIPAQPSAATQAAAQMAGVKQSVQTWQLMLCMMQRRQRGVSTQIVQHDMQGLDLALSSTYCGSLAEYALYIGCSWPPCPRQPYRGGSRARSRPGHTNVGVLASSEVAGGDQG